EAERPGDPEPHSGHAAEAEAGGRMRRDVTRALRRWREVERPAARVQPRQPAADLDVGPHRALALQHARREQVRLLEAPFLLVLVALLHRERAEADAQPVAPGTVALEDVVVTALGLRQQVAEVATRAAEAEGRGEAPPRCTLLG